MGSKQRWAKVRYGQGPIRKSDFLFKSSEEKVDQGSVSYLIDTLHIHLLKVSSVSLSRESAKKKESNSIKLRKTTGGGAAPAGINLDDHSVKVLAIFQPVGRIPAQNDSDANSIHPPPSILPFQSLPLPPSLQR